MQTFKTGEVKVLKEVLSLAVIAHAAKLRKAGLKQITIADLMGLKQTEVSQMLRDRLDLSLVRLIKTLDKVGKPVSMTVTIGND